MPLKAPSWKALPVDHKAAMLREVRRRKLRLLYRYDVPAFAHDLIEWPEGGGLAPYQEEVLASIHQEADGTIRTDGRAAMYGPHGTGKTVIEAIALLHFALTRDGFDGWKAVNTAGVWRQLTKFLWPEIHLWAKAIRFESAEAVFTAGRTVGRHSFDLRRELLDLSLKLATGEAFGVASNDPQQIEGAHAESLFYGFDESKIISGDTFDSAEGAFSAAGAGHQEAFALATSTPGEPVGRFHDICSRKPGFEAWRVRHVTKDEAIRAGRMSSAWALEAERRWGSASTVYLNRVEGLFAASDEEGIIPLAWVEVAVERWRQFVGQKTTALELPRFIGVDERWRLFLEAGGADALGALTHLGVDVSDGGEDDTVLAPRYGLLCGPLRYHPTGDPAVTASRAQAVVSAWPRAVSVVDAIGVGAGTLGAMRMAGCRVEGFVASEGVKQKDRNSEFGYLNRRAHAWWSMREILEPGYAEVMLPPDDRLIGDLTAPRWKLIAGGRIQVESKDDLRRADRLGRSPDAGDAVVMAYYGEALGGTASSNADMLTGSM